MLNDVVIDTNVFVHANTPTNNRFEKSVKFLKKLINCNTFICLDKGFNFDISKNKSLIGAEYIKHLVPGSLGFNLVINLISNFRVREMSRNVPERERKIITQKIRNPWDKVFLKVAFNSHERILVSHDYTDFQANKRVYLKGQIGVSIIEAKECSPVL